MSWKKASIIYIHQLYKLYTIVSVVITKLCKMDTLTFNDHICIFYVSRTCGQLAVPKYVIWSYYGCMPHFFQQNNFEFFFLSYPWILDQSSKDNIGLSMGMSMDLNRSWWYSGIINESPISLPTDYSWKTFQYMSIVYNCIRNLSKQEHPM